MQPLLNELLNSGFQLYKAHATEESVTTFERAVQLAAGMGDASVEAEARFWKSCARHGKGELHGALASIAPVLNRRELTLANGWVYRAATRYLRVLVELPAPHDAIERAAREIEEGTAAAGSPEWRSRTTICRARLALSTGEWERCAQLAAEALDQRQRDPWGFTCGSYYWLAVLSSIWLSRLEDADKLLEEWGGAGEHFLVSQRVYRAWLHSCRLRRAGRADEALDHARTAYHEAFSAQGYMEHYTASCELNRVHLALGETEAAATALRAVLDLRGTEVGEHAFHVRVLVADHLLARARRLAGLPGLDVEFHHVYPRPADDSHRDPAAALRVLGRAGSAYERLFSRAGELDQTLGCTLRQWQLTDRLAWVERTREEIG